MPTDLIGGRDALQPAYGRGMRWNATYKVFSIAAVVTLASVVAVGCGDDDDDDEASSADRYCELVQELDEAGSEAFAELEEDESATDEDFAEAERQFLDDHQSDFDELREVAPDEIADDIDVLLAAQEERAAGGEQEETSDAVAAAEERVIAFEQEHCAVSG